MIKDNVKLNTVMIKDNVKFGTANAVAEIMRSGSEGEPDLELSVVEAEDREEEVIENDVVNNVIDLVMQDNVDDTIIYPTICIEKRKTVVIADNVKNMGGAFRKFKSADAPRPNMATYVGLEHEVNKAAEWAAVPADAEHKVAFKHLVQAAYKQGVLARRDGGRMKFIGDENNRIIVSTDGSSRGNGTENARAGAGVYWRPLHPLNAGFAIPSCARHTNNIGEVFAAIVAVAQAGGAQLNSISIETDCSLLYNAIVTG